MDKVYRLLDWLDSAQVIDWLGALTGTPMTPSLLRAICVAEKCPVYLDCRGLEGFINTDEPGIGYPASGTGYSRIINPAVLKPLTLTDDEKGQPLLFVAPTQWLELEGPVVTRSATETKEHLSQHWSALPPNSHIVHFKTADIRSLADKMNEAEAMGLNQSAAASTDSHSEQDDYEEDDFWWKKYELERECRVRTQAEVDELAAKLAAIGAEAKPSHLLAIAALLELLLDSKRPRYNQGTAAQEIEDRFQWYGASASKITKLFAEAKAAASEADKVAKAKAQIREAAIKKAAARNTAKS